MPSQYDMSADTELYRAILEFDVQPKRDERNPHYDPRANANHPMYRKNEMWREFIQVPDGPEVAKERIIGPYHGTGPIKAYVTRNRGRYNSKNLRIKRVERVTAWEEVTDY